MADTEGAKAALAALADTEPERREGAPEGRTVSGATRAEGRRESTVEAPADTRTASTAPTGNRPAEYRTVIERAVAATDDLDAAAEFVDSVGLDRLEAAVQQAEHEVSGLADEGREALLTFERFRIAAEGPMEE